MKGHTHEDVDQAFSRASTMLGRENVCSFSDLQNKLKECFTPEPTILQVDAMYDIKEWMKVLHPGLHNIVHPHCFKLLPGPDGVYLKYKNWDSDSEWLPNANGVLLVQVGSCSHVDLCV